MDLTIPYTFYPTALPHWIAWVLFIFAILGGIAAGFMQGARRSWAKRVGVGLISTVGCLFVTMIASMVITFFVHD